MKKSKFLAFVVVVILLVGSVLSVNAATYIIDDYGSVYEVEGNTLVYSGYQGTSSKVEIPSSFYNKPVVKVAPFALKDNLVMDHLSFEYAYNLQAVGDYAFMGCNKIQSVYMEKTDVSVGCGAFRECTGLVYSEFYANNNVIPEELFYGCSNLKTVKLSSSLTKIEKYAFRECTQLEYLELPKTVVSIEEAAFKDSNKLILGVWSDSYAHQYAEDNNIRYILLDGPKLGDVNGDGNVDILDSTEIQKFAAEKVEFFNEQYDLADINNDGYVDVMDALLVQKATVGKYEIPETIIRY